jgi:hypothetical protein
LLLSHLLAAVLLLLLSHLLAAVLLLLLSHLLAAVLLLLLLSHLLAAVLLLLLLSHLLAAVLLLLLLLLLLLSHLLFLCQPRHPRQMESLCRLFVKHEHYRTCDPDQTGKLWRPKKVALQTMHLWPRPCDEKLGMRRASYRLGYVARNGCAWQS